MMTPPTASRATASAGLVDAVALAKASTGIVGFDDISGGGLPRGRTALITAKSDRDTTLGAGQQPFGFMQFMVDCAVVLNHGITLGVSQRSPRLRKYRGSTFDENEPPFVIGPSGFDVAITRKLGRVGAVVSTERIGSGVKGLDTMFGGGCYRGAAVLVTGFTGTAKTNLSGAFAEAACGRGERTLFVSFDCDVAEVVRNLGSVGIRLDRHVASGLLRMVSARTMFGSAETRLVRINALARTHGARCLVIDPVSTLSTAGSELNASRRRCWRVPTSRAGATPSCASCVAPTMRRARARADMAMIGDAAYSFRLYIAGEAVNAAQALFNLQALCRVHLAGRHSIEVVDVFREPERALADGIFMTPTLLRLAPLPLRKVVGTLSDTATLMQALDLPQLGMLSSARP